MQATESARAKIQANNSPRSSPDVQDRDTYIKKRHSLPVANGRHGSPRIQRSLSQAQQGAKGNGTLHVTCPNTDLGTVGLLDVTVHIFKPQFFETLMVLIVDICRELE
ncbi:hypothetical protein CISIN_1g045606mg [Citrus sinensis]|uniref:DUF4005 domain-containing protein n=1 Tax=Citrus sinensis TaxID=2711 RepID=A0A067HAG5_CITSI|nr:hypothetical protein CISIN_1g045606mg [Citrus sinensis]